MINVYAGSLVVAAGDASAQRPLVTGHGWLLSALPHVQPQKWNTGFGTTSNMDFGQ
eukprot:COSAG05_NODE_1459_length_4826_cov_2.560609_1_plen_55_part_10